ncbi:YybH family protein [Streptomyces sp. P1-3]|uniref:YybH family protein n=1 Tax=Streptomyces sp. P1-3 TaxID=3421658 RepID=UPI003D35DB77
MPTHSAASAASAPPPLPAAAHDLPAVFAERFNSGDAAAVRELYEEGAVFVRPTGTPATTPEAISRANADFLGLGLPIAVTPRHIHVAGDIALLIVDWRLAGTAPDGTPVRIEATATDVARRGPDGRWRYVIDSPFGAATERSSADGLSADRLSTDRPQSDGPAADTLSTDSPAADRSSSPTT